MLNTSDGMNSTFKPKSVVIQILPAAELIVKQFGSGVAAGGYMDKTIYSLRLSVCMHTSFRSSLPGEVIAPKMACIT